MSREYGAAPDELHPDRNEVVSCAFETFEHNEDTKADRVILWFDVALNAAWAKNTALAAVNTILDDERRAAVAEGTRVKAVADAALARGAELKAERDVFEVGYRDEVKHRMHLEGLLREAITERDALAAEVGRLKASMPL